MKHILNVKGTRYEVDTIDRALLVYRAAQFLYWFDKNEASKMGE